MKCGNYRSNNRYSATTGFHKAQLLKALRVQFNLFEFNLYI